MSCSISSPSWSGWAPVPENGERVDNRSGGHESMKATIDRRGRVVIPLALRKRAGFEPGTELEVQIDEFGIRLVRDVPRPELVVQEGRLIARPTVSPEKRLEFDVAAWIELERAK